MSVICESSRAKVPSVSILVASYNYAHYLPEALDSLRAQSVTDWEALIIDDGSEDQSLEIIDKYCRSDSRFKLLQHENGCNKGLSATLQLGLREAAGHLIGFLEADDHWGPDALAERQRVLNTYPDVAMVFDRPLILQYGTRSLVYYHELFAILKNIYARRTPPQTTFIELLSMNFIPTFSCVLVRRDVLESCCFQTPVGPLLDKWLWQQVTYKGKCYFLNRCNTFWRFHEASYMNRQPSEARQGVNGMFAKSSKRLLQPLCRSEGRWGRWIALQWMLPLGMGMRCWFKLRALGASWLWHLLKRRFWPMSRVSDTVRSFEDFQ